MNGIERKEIKLHFVLKKVIILLNANYELILNKNVQAP